MNPCQNKCDDPICQKVGCLNVPAYRYREMIEFALKHQKSTVIESSQSTDDANIFGEMLRKRAFVAGTGCYSCFDLTPDFETINKGSELGLLLLDKLGWSKVREEHSLLETDTDEEFNETSEKYNTLYSRANLFSNGVISLGWVWDGDGHLVIMENNRIAENTDCKKDYTWRWLSQ